MTHWRGGVTFISGHYKDTPNMATMDWTTPETILSDMTDGNLTLSTPKEVAKGLTFYDIRLNRAPIRLKLSNDITAAFEPSSWGNADASRMTLTLDVPDGVLAAIFELEDSCRQLLEEKHPDVRSMWISAIKPTDTSGGRLRTKIMLDGPRAARFYDEVGQITTAPETWRGRSLQAIVHARAIYVQKTGIGIMLGVTDVRIGPPVVHQYICPFD